MKEKKTPNPPAAAAAAAEGRGFSRSEESIVISLLISPFCHSSKQTVRWVWGAAEVVVVVEGDFPIKWMEHKGEEQAAESFIEETEGGWGLVTKAGADVGAFYRLWKHPSLDEMKGPELPSVGWDTGPSGKQRAPFGPCRTPYCTPRTLRAETLLYMNVQVMIW